MVDMYCFFPYTWVIHLARVLISFNIIHTVLKDKYNSIVTFLSLVVTGMVFSYLSLSVEYKETMDVLVIILYYFVQLAVTAVVCKGGFFSKLAAVIFSFGAYICSASVYQLISTLILGKEGALVFQTSMPLSTFMSAVTIVYASSFLFMTIIKFVKGKTDGSLSYKNKYSYFLLFPLTHIITLSACFSSREQTAEEVGDMVISDFVIIISSCICIAIDFFLVFLIDYIEKIENDNIEREKELVKNKVDFQQTLMLNKEKEEFRKIKHDFTNIINTAKGFIEIGKPEKALSILQSTDDRLLGLAGFSICSNETVNTIIFIKQQQAESRNIKLLTEINDNYKILIDDFDLCRLLCNIIDNAVNAVSETQGEKICKITINTEEEEIQIKSENKYNGKGKTDGKKSPEHGNGIKIIKEIVNKYGGDYTITQNSELWVTNLSVKNKSCTPPHTHAHYGVSLRFGN